MTSKVLASGKFDLIHPGHIYYLARSKELAEGGELWVVITHEDNIENNLFSNRERKEMVEAMEAVDRVIVGESEVDYVGTIKIVDPDVIALGHDQDRESVENALRTLGKKIRIERIDSRKPKKYSSSDLRRLLREKIGQ